MRKYLKLITSQIKRIGKDNLLLLLSVYPLILAVVGRFLVPFLRESFLDKFDLIIHYPAIAAFFILANPYIYGALAAFLLLDEREVNVLQVIRVTPITLNKYLMIKVAFFTAISFVSGLAIIKLINLVDISLFESIYINALLSLAAPFNLILINAFAKNRVEGFALVKGSGILIMLPLLAFYIPEQFNLMAGIVPGYWPAMAIRKIVEPSFGIMPYWAYALVGLIYILILMKFLAGKFKKSIS